MGQKLKNPHEYYPKNCQPYHGEKQCCRCEEEASWWEQLEDRTIFYCDECAPYEDAATYAIENLPDGGV